MKAKTKIQILITAALGAIFAVKGIDNTLTLSDYVVRSDKIRKPVNIVFLSDIHSEKFKDGGKELFKMIEKSHPDCILFGGDIFDKYASDEEHLHTFELLEKISERFGNCFFVTGNHEEECGKADEFRKKLSELGIKSFSGESVVITGKSGQSIVLGGSDFADIENETPDVAFGLANKAKENGLFSVLLRHVPFRKEFDNDIDLILSGHNHGGLWRFPHTNTGIAGGGKTFFPRYSHGEYRKGDSLMIVGGGISTNTYGLPRLYNTPEVVHVMLMPEINLPC